MNHKFLFIDRDGTLIEEPYDNSQVDCIEKISLEPNVIPSLITLQKAGFILVMITNQDGLGTASFSKKNFYNSHNFLIKIFASQNIIFNKVLICPHFIKDKCTCRKPKTALIYAWLQNKKIDVKKSYVIGDRKTDIILANNLGIEGILYRRNKFNWFNITQKLTINKRYAKVHRITNETNISIELSIENFHLNKINTGIKFFDHMLEQIAIHSGLNINIQAKGDIDVDDHHLIEDIALVFGKALKKALGNKLGIRRFGFILPMDDCLAHCILDISNRPFLNYKAHYNFQKIGDLSTEMIEHFFYSLSNAMACTIYLKTKGKNDHHKAESLFKAFGRALRQAIYIENNIIPSSKGTLQ